MTKSVNMILASTASLGMHLAVGLVPWIFFCTSLDDTVAVSTKASSLRVDDPRSNSHSSNTLTFNKIHFCMASFA